MDSDGADDADTRLDALRASLQEQRARAERAIQENRDLIQENQLEVTMAQLARATGNMREEVRINEGMIQLNEEARTNGSYGKKMER